MIVGGTCLKADNISHELFEADLAALIRVDDTQEVLGGGENKRQGTNRARRVSVCVQDYATSKATNYVFPPRVKLYTSLLSSPSPSLLNT